MPVSSAAPNILLILTDQQRYDTLGCYGVEGVHTPNLDRLAAQGARFDHCYVNNPVCTPSRASIWTGKHLSGHGVYALHDILPDDEVLFPLRLCEAGYDTALLGKLHVSGHLAEARQRHPHDGFRIYEWAPDPRGFLGCETAYHQWLEQHHPEVRERWRNPRAMGHVPIPAHMTTWAADRTISFLTADRDKTKPFFCCMSVFDPHDPYTNHPKEAEQGLDPARYPDVWAPDESFSHRPLAHWLERQYSYQGPVGAIDIETLRRWRLGYHAAVALIDMQVGRVLQALESQGLAKDTLVIFTSDHGDMMGDHNLLAKGCFFYDPCTRVPMILRAPGRPAGEVIGTPVQPHDIAATCLTAAELPANAIGEWMPDARDLLSPPALEQRGYAACLHRNSMLVVDRERGWKDYHSPPLHGTMWREGRFKLNIHQASGRRDPCPGELYDLEADPREMRNLWNDPEHHDTRERLLQRLLDWLVEQDFQGRARGEDAMPTSDTYRIIARAA